MMLFYIHRFANSGARFRSTTKCVGCCVDDFLATSVPGDRQDCYRHQRLNVNFIAASWRYIGLVVKTSVIIQPFSRRIIVSQPFRGNPETLESSDYHWGIFLLCFFPVRNAIYRPHLAKMTPLVRKIRKNFNLATDWENFRML